MWPSVLRGVKKIAVTSAGHNRLSKVLSTNDGNGVEAFRRF